MVNFLSHECLEKLGTIAIGIGAFIYGRHEEGVIKMVEGASGIGAFAAGKALKKLENEEETAQAVFAEVQKKLSNRPDLLGNVDPYIAANISSELSRLLEKMDFPIGDLQIIAQKSGAEEGLFAALAEHILEGLAPESTTLCDNIHRPITKYIITEAIKAGVHSSQTITNDILITLGNKAILVAREEGEKNRAHTTSESDRVIATLMAAINAQNPSSKAVENAAMIELAKRILPTVETMEQALAELTNAVSIFLEMKNTIAQGTNAGELVQIVLDKMAALQAQGKFDEAANEATIAFEKWEKAEQERQESAKQQGIAFLDAGINQDILRRDAKSTADRMLRKIQLSVAIQSEHFLKLDAVFTEYWERGRDKGINFDLEIAIEIANAQFTMAIDANQKGRAKNNLGNALQTLGGRESGTVRLEAAVDAYNAALQEWTRDKVPLQWAMTQNNLGNALKALGERESGTERLEAAVDAYNAALEELTRDKVPLDWAMTQCNLGNALQTLGGRESGTARLKEAVSAYRLALEERIRDKVPLDWAMTQSNLGAALTAIGERESGTERLEAAVDAYRAALEERTRDKAPLQWAMTQNNLGNALSALGERESGTERLVAAVEAYNAALEEWTRDKVPLQWAMTQNNLGAVLFTLGGRESGTERLEAAVDAYNAALEERTRDKVPLDWAMSMGNKANADAIIAARGKDCPRLRQAIADLQTVIAVFEAADHQGYLPFCRHALNRAQANLGAVSGE